MDRDEYISIVSETDADIGQFNDMALKDDVFQNLVVSLLLSDERINVYYHSYHILKNIAYKKPDSLVRFWDDFVLLLDHSNSYHRNYGMDLISSLAASVDDDKFGKILPTFYKMLYDKKISTRKFCITYSIANIISKPEFGNDIVNRIMASFDNQNINTKHRVLLCKEFVRLLEETGFEMNDRILQFMNRLIDESETGPLNRAIARLLKSRN